MHLPLGHALAKMDAQFTGGHMLVRVAIAVALFLLPSALQAQEKRIALLIGNQGYGSQIGRLTNPP
jgi:hypothetical protein